jgi:hypothetical protein
LSSSPDILSLTWYNLLQRLSTEFFCLIYWAFHLQDFNFIFSEFLYLYRISFPFHALSSLFPSILILSLLGTYYVPFNFFDHSCNHFLKILCLRFCSFHCH